MTLGGILNWRAGAEPRIGESLSDDPWPVKQRKLLTAREQGLYQRLLGLYPDHKLFIQVALSQLIDVDHSHPQSESIRARYKQLVADFVLCRPDLAIVAVIELDDRTHERSDRQAADARKNKALADAGIRLVRIPAGRLPSDDALRTMIDGEESLRIIPHSEVVLTLAEDTYAEEIAYHSEDESSAVSKEFKRVGVKVLLIVSLVLGGWLFFSVLLPMATQQAFRPSATQVRAAQPKSTSPVVVRPQNPALATPSGPNAAAAAALREQTLQVANALQRKKDLAWAAFYSAPTSCEHPADWSAQVECGNLYMRAKKVFEQKWAAEHPGEGSGAGALDNLAVGRVH